MFRSQARLLNFEPQNGMQVLAYGHATIYERDGRVPAVCRLYAPPLAQGAAQMAFDALYKKLEAEGIVCAGTQTAAARSTRIALA